MKKLTPFLLLTAAFLLLSACQTNTMISDPFANPDMTDEITINQPEEEKIEETMEKEATEEPTETDEKMEEVTEEPAVEKDSEEMTEEPADDTAMEEETETPPAEEKDSESVPAETEASVRSFTMTAKQFEFVPNTITVSEGDQVEITATSTDVEHGFFLPDFGVDVKLPPNETQIIRFTADKKGTFSFRCNVFCGDGHGEMTGTLIVQ